LGDQVPDELERVCIASGNRELLVLRLGRGLLRLAGRRGSAADLDVGRGETLEGRVVAQRAADQRLLALAREILGRSEPAFETVSLPTHQVVNDHAFGFNT